MTAKILHLDIETAPNKVYVWGIWNVNVALNQIEDDWYVLCYAAKWHNEEDVYYDALIRYPKDYKKDPENDYNILLTVRDLLDEADIVVAHNGVRFDIPKLNARFLKHGINPPSPFKQVDTLRVAKRNFNLTSNKLDYIAQYLGLGKKETTGGFDLWKQCMAGNKQAWEKMIDYNIQDVRLLEKVYTKLLPWISNHPNLALFNKEVVESCPKCGGTHLQWRGYYPSSVGLMRKFQCQDCGGWGRTRFNELSKEKRKSVLTNATL